MHIEIDSNEVTPETTAKGNVMRKQNAYLWGHTKYPLPFKLTINGDAPGYAPGHYMFSASSFKLTPFGGVELNGFNTTLEKLSDTQMKALSN